MVLPQITDEDLVQRCRSATGEQRRELAGELFARYYDRVGRWCFRFMGARESAADLAQDVFAKAYRHLDKFEANARFSTWLYVIARNECLNAIEARSRELAEDGEDMLAQIVDPAAGAGEQMEREQAASTLRQLLSEELDETERTVFTLHFGDDLSLEAITRVLRLQNASGAKAYIVSAKRKLSRAVSRLRAKGRV